MSCYKVLLVFIISGILIIASLTSAWAQIEINPRISVEQKYTDNLFLDSSNEQDDWVTTVGPGINISYDTRSVDFSLDYALQYIFYQENGDRNSDDFEDIQRATGSAFFFSGRPFNLSLTQQISRETLDERENSFEDNEVVNRSTVFRTTVLPSYRFNLAPTYSLVVSYIYSRVDFSEDEGNDSEEHTGKASFIKALSSNSEISLNYAYKAHHSKDDVDFDQQDFFLGFTHQFGSRLSGSLEAGWSKVENDDGTDSDSPNWLLALSYRATEALTFGVDYGQSFVSSATEGLTEAQKASLSAEYQKNIYAASAEIFWRQTDFERSDREDESLGSLFSITVPLSNYISTNFNAKYEKSKYDNGAKEEVDRYTLGTSINFNYRRLATTLGYRYRHNDSDIDSDDYTNNVVLLSASLRF